MPVFDAIVEAFLTTILAPALALLQGTLAAFAAAFDILATFLTSTLTDISIDLFQALPDIIQILLDGFRQILTTLQDSLSGLNNLWTQLPPITRFFTTIAPLGCIIAASIADPHGAINQFMLYWTDLIVAFLPSSPDEIKIGTIENNLITQYPVIGYFIWETFDGIIKVLTIVATIKSIKLLPFMG